MAEEEDWARVAVLDAAEKAGAVALRSGTDRALAAQAVSWSPNPALRHRGDVAVLMMTSGTTGRPKRVERRTTAWSRLSGRAGWPSTRRSGPS